MAEEGDSANPPPKWREQLRQLKENFMDWLNADPNADRNTEVPDEADKPTLTTPITNAKQSYIEYMDYHYGDGYAESVGVPSMYNDELRDAIESMIDMNESDVDREPSFKTLSEERNVRLQQMLVLIPDPTEVIIID